MREQKHSRLDHSSAFASFETDEVILDACPIEGTLPIWLQGSYLCTGPARWELKHDKLNHWFDGLALLQRFSLKEQKASYKAKFVRSPAFTFAMKTGKIGYPEAFSRPNLFNSVRQIILTTLQTIFGVQGFGRNTNVTVCKVEDEFLAWTETPYPLRFDPDTLDTLNASKLFDDNCFKGAFVSPHLHALDGKTLGLEIMLEMSLKLLTSTIILWQKKSDTEKRTIIWSKKARSNTPPYIHSFSVTHETAIIVEYPLFWDPLRIITSSFYGSMRWRSNIPCLIHLIDLNSSESRTVEVEPFFSLHHINAYRTSQEWILDLVSYENGMQVPAMLRSITIENIRTFTQPILYGGVYKRLIIPTSKHLQVKSEILSENIVETPTIHYSVYNGTKHRFSYASGFSSRQTWRDQIIKIDASSGKSTIWSSNGCYPAEPLFIEKPGSTHEDEGVLLSITFDSTVQKSFLLLLDARTMNEIARIYLHQTLPLPVHGYFYSL